jgi:hypothetical protein
VSVKDPIQILRGVMLVGVLQVEQLDMESREKLDMTDLQTTHIKPGVSFENVMSDHQQPPAAPETAFVTMEKMQQLEALNISDGTYPAGNHGSCGRANDGGSVAVLALRAALETSRREARENKILLTEAQAESSKLKGIVARLEEEMSRLTNSSTEPLDVRSPTAEFVE